MGRAAVAINWPTFKVSDFLLLILWDNQSSSAKSSEKILCELNKINNSSKQAKQSVIVIEVKHKWFDPLKIWHTVVIKSSNTPTVYLVCYLNNLLWKYWWINNFILNLIIKCFIKCYYHSIKLLLSLSLLARDPVCVA